MNLLLPEEIKRRLVRLRNLEHLYVRAKARILVVETENKKLKQRVRELEGKDRDKDRKIEAMAYQLEQVTIKLFGKKPLNRILPKKEKKVRGIASYRRPIPTHTTETRPHPVLACTHCHGTLQKKHTTVFFEEDIPLPIQKLVIKHEVEVGYCPSCKRQSSGYPIPSKKSVLGAKVKKYVCVLSIANRLSHSQIQDHLIDVFDLNLSTGEIGNIMETEANNLRPEYQSLKESVLSQRGSHYDETGWKGQKEEQGKYAWVVTGTENNDTVFSLGRSRGKGNIEDIGTANLGISDDYGAYKNTFQEHQLCWAHPQRKLRELVESNALGEKKRAQTLKTYEQFSNLYQRIRKRISDEISPYLKRKFLTNFAVLSAPHARDPSPLVKIKTSLRKNKEKYFTFLDHPGIPLDNNKAERALRHLVIKRRTSFGSKTQRGAETTSILASVILSLKWNNPQHWFQEYFEVAS